MRGHEFFLKRNIVPFCPITETRVNLHLISLLQFLESRVQMETNR